MIDLFGRRARVNLTELEATCKKLSGDNIALRTDIRKMDQLVFTISQQPTLERMRPALQELTALTEKRMQAENNRIKGILMNELGVHL